MIEKKLGTVLITDETKRSTKNERNGAHMEMNRSPRATNIWEPLHSVTYYGMPMKQPSMVETGSDAAKLVEKVELRGNTPRERKNPFRLVINLLAIMRGNDESKRSFAMSGEHSYKWHVAMDKEISTL